MKTAVAGLAFAILTSACNSSKHSTMAKFDSAEAAVQYVSHADLSTPTFALAISNDLTVSGRPDPMGLGMALVLNAILAEGFEPDEFQQESGYRVYRYKRMKA